MQCLSIVILAKYPSIYSIIVAMYFVDDFDTGKNVVLIYDFTSLQYTDVVESFII